MNTTRFSRGDLAFTIDDEAVVIGETAHLGGIEVATITFLAGPRTGSTSAATTAELRPETTVEEHERFIAGNDDVPPPRRVVGTDLDTIAGLRR